MDFLTQQFIAAARELKKKTESLGKLLLGIRKALYKQNKAINEATEAQKKQGASTQILLTKLNLANTPQGENKFAHDQTGPFKWLEFSVSVATLFIVAAYTTLTAFQLIETQNAVDAANRSARAAETANANATNADRPWVGIEFTLGQDLNPDTSQALVFYLNSGRRPAKLLEGTFYSHDYKVFPDNPIYAPTGNDIKGVGIVMPNRSMTNTQPFRKITAERIGGLRNNGTHFFMYAKIRYEDVVTHEQHWTHGCWEFYPGFPNILGGWVNCSKYNDAGDIPKPH